MVVLKNTWVCKIKNGLLIDATHFLDLRLVGAFFFLEDDFFFDFFFFEAGFLFLEALFFFDDAFFFLEVVFFLEATFFFFLGLVGMGSTPMR